MKHLCILLFVILLPIAVVAEDSTFVGWKKTLVVDLTTTQTGYSDSWVGGEAGSFNWVSNLNGTAEKFLSPTFNYRSALKVSFGQTVTQDKETKDWSDFEKSTDLIDWENVGKIKKGWAVDPYLAFRLETQFYDGRVDTMKQYFSPLKLTESIGVSKEFYKKDKEVIMTRLGVAFRQTYKSVISMADTANYTVIDSTITDDGLELVTDAALKLSENIVYTGKLTLFKAFFSSEKDAVGGNDYWKAVDINFENIFAAKISKVITVIMYTQFLYDKEITKKGRFKEAIAVGFVFNMI